MDFCPEPVNPCPLQVVRWHGAAEPELAGIDIIDRDVRPGDDDQCVLLQFLPMLFDHVECVEGGIRPVFLPQQCEKAVGFLDSKVDSVGGKAVPEPKRTQSRREAVADVTVIQQAEAYFMSLPALVS